MIHLTFSGTGCGTLKYFSKQLSITQHDTILYPDLALQAGKIYDPFNMKLRRDVYDALYPDCYEHECETLKNTQGALQKCKEFTIWYSSQWTDDLLSMLFFVHTHKNKRIYLQDLSYAGHNLCSLQELRNIEHRRPVELSDFQKEAISQEWKRLVNENADFRILSDGRICSVADDYYDNDILSKIGHENIKIAQICEQVLNKYTDYYDSIIYRIMMLIKDGTLIPTETDSITYTGYLVRKA